MQSVIVLQFMCKHECGVWDFSGRSGGGNSGEQFVHCVIEDMECSCDAGNKLRDFWFGRYFPLLDGCVDFYCELIDSFDTLIWHFRRGWSGCVRLFHWRFENTPLNPQQLLSRVVALLSPFLKALACNCVTLDVREAKSKIIFVKVIFIWWKPTLHLNQ